MAAQRWDEHLKRVVPPALREVLQLAKVPVPADALEEQNPELFAIDNRRADLVYATRSGDVVHIELQKSDDRRMAERMAVYAALLVRARPHGVRVRDLTQIVLQIEGPPMTVGLAVGGFRNEVHLLHVPSLEPADLLSSPALAPLALARGGAALVPAVAASLRRLDPEIRVSALTLALQTAPGLADTVLAEMRRNGMTDVVEVLRTTDWGRGLLEEGREEGREAGREEGREAGREEGREAGREEGRDAERRRAVLTILDRRFPSVPAASLERAAEALVRRAGEAAIQEALDLTSLEGITHHA